MTGSKDFYAYLSVFDLEQPLKAMRSLLDSNVVLRVDDRASGNETMEGNMRDVREYGNVDVTQRERAPIVPDRGWKPGINAAQGY